MRLIKLRFGLHCAQNHTLKMERVWEIFPDAFADYNKKDTEPWHQFSSAVDEFNNIYQKEVPCGSWISIDETMYTWKPRKTATGVKKNLLL
jgi:hypothetical protein